MYPIPIGFTHTVQSKIEQSKMKCRVIRTNNPGGSAFVFRLFTPSFFFLKNSHNLCLLTVSKAKKRVKQKEK